MAQPVAPSITDVQMLLMFIIWYIVKYSWYSTYVPYYIFESAHIYSCLYICIVNEIFFPYDVCEICIDSMSEQWLLDGNIEFFIFFFWENFESDQ